MGSQTFNYTGGPQTFTVPAKVTKITVRVDGGSAGQVAGGRVQGVITAKAGDKFTVQVGRAGVEVTSGTTGGSVSYGGGGAGGTGTTRGGSSGGGASLIRKGGGSGSVVAVAGGAGGASGDHTFSPPVGSENVNGRGGRGGAATGEHGFPGNSAGTTPSNYANAGGGTQSQGGFSGNNALLPARDGGDAPNTVAGLAGGGGPGGAYGGGGGGGGFRSGGGGQGASSGIPGGGGGGGSNYTGGLSSATSGQGTAALGNGVIVFTWSDPGKTNNAPTTPTDVTIGGVAESEGLATHSTGTVKICATIDDPNAGQQVRLMIQYSAHSNMSSAKTVYSDYVEQKGKTDTNPVKVCVTLTGLATNTHYYARLYTEDHSRLFSPTYNAIDFWTDRPPNAPTLTNPVDNAQFPDVQNIVFQWGYTDPDGASEAQRGFQLEYRQIVPIGTAERPWTLLANQPESPTRQWTVNATDGHFTPNNAYQWRVRTRDSQGLWGPFSLPFRFALAGDTKAPTLIHPIGNIAVPVDVPIEFDWKYNDPRGTLPNQHHADIRWREVGTDDWTTLAGDTVTPGGSQKWLLQPGLFAPGTQYEWQVRTWNSATTVSAWSTSATFWAILTPGSGIVDDPLPSSESQPAPPLGCGQNRVYVYERGARRLIGEIIPAQAIQWTRKRDDISTCNVSTNGFGWDCGQMLANLRSFQHELVVFRDGVRVWEGPITRIAYFTDRVEIEARDVMTYLYRRILRQGYNDAYQVLNGAPVGIRSVVERAGILIVNGLAYDDPNILPYLTLLSSSADAKESRVVAAYSRTVWEEVDDLAATAGLDYTVAGRRIILWDTHQQIGLLPEMRDGDFSDSPVVTEYGMNLANYFAVTNNSGVYGDARAGDNDGKKSKPPIYGWVEQLASAYGESTGGGSSTTLTASALAQLQAQLSVQARANIAHRWPAPVIVRVPDNATLNPEINVGINQLIPGIHIPLRASNTLRPISQLQKLDSVTVVQDASGEKVNVVMSPAPLAGEDPDADIAATED